MSQESTVIAPEEWPEPGAATEIRLLPVTGAAITGSGNRRMAYLLLGGCWIQPHFILGQRNGKDMWYGVTWNPQPLSLVFPEVTRKIPFDQRVQINLMYHAKTVTLKSQSDFGRTLGFGQTKSNSKNPHHINYNLDKHIADTNTPDWWPGDNDLPVLGAAVLPGGSVLYATPAEVKIFSRGKSPKSLGKTPAGTTALCHDPDSNDVYFFTSPTKMQVARLAGKAHKSYQLGPTTEQSISDVWDHHPYGNSSVPRGQTPQAAIATLDLSGRKSAPPTHSVSLLDGLNLTTGTIAQGPREDTAYPARTVQQPAVSAAETNQPASETGAVVLPVVKPQLARITTSGLKGLYSLLPTCSLSEFRYEWKRGNRAEGKPLHNEVNTVDKSGSGLHIGSPEQAPEVSFIFPQTFDGKYVLARDNLGEIVRCNTQKDITTPLTEIKNKQRYDLICERCTVSREGVIYRLTPKGVDVLARDDDGEYEKERSIVFPKGFPKISKANIWLSATGGRLIVCANEGPLHYEGFFRIVVIDPESKEDPIAGSIAPVEYGDGPEVRKTASGGLRARYIYSRPEWCCPDPNGRYLYVPVVLNVRCFVLIVDLASDPLSVIGRYEIKHPYATQGDPTFAWYWANRE